MEDVGQPGAVGGEARIDVDLVVVGEAVGLPGACIQHFQLGGAAAGVSRVHQPAPVRGPVGRGEVVLRADQLGRYARCRVDAPDRPAHAHRDALAVRRPGGIPRGGAGGGGEVEVVHVVAAVRGSRVRALRFRKGGSRRRVFARIARCGYGGCEQGGESGRSWTGRAGTGAAGEQWDPAGIGVLPGFRERAGAPSARGVGRAVVPPAV